MEGGESSAGNAGGRGGATHRTTLMATTRLLHEFLIELGAHEAGQRILLHQGVDPLLGHIKAAQ